MDFIKNDGGRAAAGYKGLTGDCACRAIAIAAEMPYQEVYDLILRFAKEEKPSKTRRGISHPRTGVHMVTMKAVMEHLGWYWVPTMGIGTGTTTHLRKHELPRGRIVVRLSRHFAAVLDGVVHDTYRPDRGGQRAVYGYWAKRL